KNQTLIVGFGGTGMIIANEWYGRRDVKDEMGQRVDAATDKITDKVISRIHTDFDSKFDNLQKQLDNLQGLVFNCAVKTMKAIDGDKTALREFVTRAEKVKRCVELGEDCQEGIKQPKSADGSK
ncbi:hypothetical protein EDC01DRAFT_609502, partial [Geopyxis carbonaria]